MTGAQDSKLIISEEVSTALDAGEAVVALESTVITHGLPYPHNRDVALDMEREIRQLAAVPATIAVLDGLIRIGVNEDEIERLALGDGLQKLGVRDLPLAAAVAGSGGTTVAGTIFCANMAGIRIFATGGIGGVHRGSEFDVSADLIQLSRTPVIVVCSGAKAILDLHATMEYLETFSVPVVGYQTSDLPAFYSRSSGITIETQVETAAEIVDIARENWDLGLQSSILVVHPIPEEDEIPNTSINEAVEQALKEAEREGIAGKSVTPYLLGRVAEITSGKSLQANLSLLKNNARLAAEIAIADSHP
jgi:pseudouridine-5'-phosphate glycosidase